MRSFILFGCVLALVGCGSSSSGISTASSFTAEATIGSPFAQSSEGSASTNIDRSFFAQERTYEELVAEIESLNEATSLEGCQIDFDFQSQSSHAACFSPNADVIGDHPDTEEDDNFTEEDETADLLFGDGGIWDSVDDDTGNACGAAEVNKLVANVQSGTHFANLMGAALECFIRNEGSLSLPSSVGDITELSEAQLASFVEAITADSEDSFEFDSAKVTAIQTTDEEFSGYRYELSGTWNDNSDESETEYNIDVKVQNLFKDSEVKASISYAVSDPEQPAPGGCDDAGVTDGRTWAGDLLTHKSSDTDIKVATNFAEFCGVANPISDEDRNFLLDPCDEASTENTDGWAANWHHIRANYNPQTKDGDYVLVWTAGKGDRAGRVFNASVETADGVRTGRADVGYGSIIPDESGESCTGYNENLGQITGFICNWSGPNHLANGDEFQDFFQTQTFTRDADDDTADWAVVEELEKIIYAPVTACSYDPGAFPDFEYKTGEDMTADSNIVAAPDEASTSELEDLSEYSFTLPSFPTLDL